MKTLIIENKFIHIFKNNKKLYNKFLNLIDFKISDNYIEETFSIYIGDNISKEDYNLQYILNDSNEYINEHIQFISGENALTIALENAYQDFLNCNKKVLLYLGKFPAFGKDVDGGSILAKQLIDTLKVRCNLDLAFIRKNHETYSDKYVNNIYYYEYKDAFNDKFISRLENLNTNRNALINHKNYDIIIAAHVSKFFGCNFGEEFWKKTILFPMFCTHSYVRAGENVPLEYTRLEAKVINSVNKIITPSEEEKDDLLNEYDINEDKIKVIYRGISEYIKYRPRNHIGEEIKIICIGSIKKQKNNMMQLEILNKLVKNNYKVKMHLVTTIQDKQIYDSMIKFINVNHLENNVEFHFSLSQQELGKLLDKCDINISTSNWETFGRGIFEGISAGLPTLVNGKLLVVKNIVDNHDGVKFLNNVDDFYNEIIKLLDFNYYKNCSKTLISILDKVSYKAEQIKLVNTILI